MVHNVRDEKTELVVPRKEIKHSLTRQGMGPTQKGNEKGRVLLPERAHKQVSTVKSLGYYGFRPSA